MTRLAVLMRLKPGCEDEYRRAHQAVWPELIEAATQAGIRNHSVFIVDNQLFAYLEADNIDAALAELSKADAKQRWDAWMAQLLDSACPPIVLDEAFHMD